MAGRPGHSLWLARNGAEILLNLDSAVSTAISRGSMWRVSTCQASNHPAERFSFGSALVTFILGLLLPGYWYW